MTLQKLFLNVFCYGKIVKTRLSMIIFWPRKIWINQITKAK